MIRQGVIECKTGKLNRDEYNGDLESKQDMSDANLLETFENPCPERDYEIKIDCPEFTSVCPKTGQPDFGTVSICYTPDRQCLELKALKYYLQGYRNEGIFYESAINRILDDLVGACRPRKMCLRGSFTARGGITTTVTAGHP